MSDATNYFDMPRQGYAISQTEVRALRDRIAELEKLVSQYEANGRRTDAQHIGHLQKRIAELERRIEKALWSARHGDAAGAVAALENYDELE